MASAACSPSRTTTSTPSWKTPASPKSSTRSPKPKVPKPLAALVLAAGRGTRMKSALPKVLHQAGGRSLLAHVLAAVRGAGIALGDIAVVAGYGLDQIRAALAELESGGLQIILQEPQLGTGHAVLAAQSWWQNYDHLLVVHGDMPLLSSATITSLAAAAAAKPHPACVLATAEPREPRAYGRILRNANHPERVVGIVEDGVATPVQRKIRELNAGFYCFATAPLAAALARLRTNNPHGEYYLTDTIALLAAGRSLVTSVALADDRECLGVNDRVELAQLDRDFRRRKAEALMRAGVTIQFPDAVVIDPDVEVGQDTVLESGVQLLGSTRIGANCRIRSYSILEDCTVADGVLIRSHCVLEKSRIDAAAQLGPFTRLREGAHIGEAAHLGNFVEVKKSRLGRASKANHLAYLGDATIGAGVNIGAGTITCNYDGSAKHPTTIADAAFIGSNATLVAPLEIGPGSYIAAGSVITDPVPADTLALGRARQTLKPGWPSKRRQKRD
ncbi:MAG: UDP-N-acetylglucosamine diphosphorylase/glucosamine-1-phosphate N-acetyltransferase [Acidobacteria bacterium]|nr:MAG: UDP-N-acetylglucosamine diphosphorylase/glucosamine-1-phosphate N-acetyltransferase [Acidobacteriota bacterium]